MTFREGYGYRKLKDRALDSNIRRTSFGRGYWPALRQTREWMEEHRCSVPHKQKRDTCPYPKPEELSPHPCNTSIYLRCIIILCLHPRLDFRGLPKLKRIIYSLPVRERRNTAIKRQPIRSLSIWKVNFVQLQRERNRRHLLDLRGLGG